MIKCNNLEKIVVGIQKINNNLIINFNNLIKNKLYSIKDMTIKNKIKIYLQNKFYNQLFLFNKKLNFFLQILLIII